MGKLWLPAVCAMWVLSVVSVAFVGAGCTANGANQPSATANGANHPTATASSSVTTKQIVDTHPEVRKAMLDRLKAQIEASKLSPDEKQRQIAKLDQNGLPQ